MTPARLAEVMAHLEFYGSERREEVLAALGYGANVEGEIAEAKDALMQRFMRDDVSDLSAFAGAYQITQRQLRARRPQLSSIKRSESLEPQLVPRASTAGPGLEPLTAKSVEPAPVAAAQPSAAPAVPSYLQADSGVNSGSPPAWSPPPPPPSNGHGGLSPKMMTTAQVDTSKLSRGRELPFAKSKSEPPDADLERFARLTVALASGEARAQVLERFKLSEAARQTYSEEWGARISSDPNLKARFDELIRKLRARPR
ncbi:MAG: hypothetical protein U0271_14715 [Polyangiaceae bacterium]